MSSNNFDPVEVAMDALHKGNLLAAKDVEMARLKELVTRMDSTINESQAECRRLKAEVERLGGNLMSEQEAGWKLIAEVERLTAYSNYLTIEANVDHARWLRTLEENDQLRAQVERLTKAGDAMAEAFELKYPVAGKLIIDWHAAKEGKQP